MQPRVLYLDIDDTVLCWNEKYMDLTQRCMFGVPPYVEPKTASVLRWMETYFEIRPLTAWTLSGTFAERSAQELAKYVGLPVEWWLSKINPRGWYDQKCEGIDFDDSRPWVWLEDDLLAKEIYLLKERGLFDRFIRCNVTENPQRLLEVQQELATRFNLPLEAV